MTLNSRPYFAWISRRNRNWSRGLLMIAAAQADAVRWLAAECRALRFLLHAAIRIIAEHDDVRFGRVSLKVEYLFLFSQSNHATTEYIGADPRNKLEPLGTTSFCA